MLTQPRPLPKRLFFRAMTRRKERIDRVEEKRDNSPSFISSGSLMFWQRIFGQGEVRSANRGNVLAEELGRNAFDH